MNTNLNDLFVALITIIITLNGIAIPLSYNIVSESLKKYSDQHMYREFLKEAVFRTNIVVSLFALLLYGLPLAFNLKTWCDCLGIECFYYTVKCIYLGVSVLTLIGFLMSFIKFSEMIYEYAANTEEVVYNKLKPEVDEVLGE